jgi:competence protein ComEA
MSEKKHELYLISFALILMAVMLLYNVFSTPEMNSIKIVNNETTSSSEKDISKSAIDVTQAETKVTEKMQNHTHVTSKKNEEPQNKIININTATVEELMTLTGIGQVKAEAIVKYRIENGKYDNIEDLLNVKGIGEKTLQKIKDSVTV